MKLILSRKGFDTSSGGCPSPILPDGELCPLPIPDKRSMVCYKDLDFNGISLGTLVKQLTNGKCKPHQGAHLDPDLVASHYVRAPGWRPVFGQSGAAQGHLNNQAIDIGDIFLFFGLFRPAQIWRRRWRFVPGSRARHILWGWLQIGDILPVADTAGLKARPWLHYHPHLQFDTEANNTLYLPSEQLSLQNLSTDLPGAGVFPKLSEGLCLTAPHATKPSNWQLPAWFHPASKTPLSYHHRPERWQLNGDYCELQAVARGQEFVLDGREYRQAASWVESLVMAHAMQLSINRKR